MSYTFKSAVTGDLIMLKEPAEHILKLIDKSATPEGIITTDQIDHALDNLKQAIELESVANELKDELFPFEKHLEESDTKKGQCISLKRRAWPLIEMLKKCKAQNADMIWVKN